MCGISGFIDLKAQTSAEELTRIVAAMTETLFHRGPDDGGHWVDPAAGVALGHRRLSIVDLSPAGHQPMVAANGRYVIVYNGEVYNSRELSDELLRAGITFRGHSDTEAILEGCALWGVPATAARLNGMFAFALWDRVERTLSLVRDRVGIKPLYWGKADDLILFGSELKALCAHPAFHPEIDRDAVAGYLRHNYVPGPSSIYRGVHKLQPGHSLTLGQDGIPHIESYWDARAIARTNGARRLAISDAEATDRLDALLRDAIGRQMVADVPLGAFLSGGIDSSTVVALMQAQSAAPIKTFSIGFHEDGYNEAEFAKAVAGHLGTDHTELYVDSRQALDVIPRLPQFYDEPFADSSQIPTFLVSEMTRRQVTVALSGDGGDELFAGYNRYVMGRTLWNRLKPLPLGLRKTIARTMCAIPPGMWERVFAPVPRRYLPAQIADKMYKLANVLAVSGPDALYRHLVSQWDDPESIVLNGHEPKGALWDAGMGDDFPNVVERMQCWDILTYLPDDILTKVDRASMAVALESRVPLLDHRVAEFAWSLPFDMKIRQGQGKWLLRQVLYRYVPKELIERPKMGFGVPIAAWLRGPLRDWAEDLLDEGRLVREGFFAPVPIRRKWEEHLSGRRNWQYPLWTVLMFQAWLAERR